MNHNFAETTIFSLAYKKMLRKQQKIYDQKLAFVISKNYFSIYNCIQMETKIFQIVEKMNMSYYTWEKLHAIVEILCQGGDKKVLLAKAMLEINKINERDVSPKFREKINDIKKNLLPPENVQLITRSNNFYPLIQRLTEDETDHVIHAICELESLLNPN